MNIEFKEGAACFANGKQWFVNHLGDDKRYQLQDFSGGSFYSFYGITNFAKDFQLNTIKQGDYIEASELDTEQKYNDAVEVLGLFGFLSEYNISNMVDYGGLLVDDPVYFFPATIACSDIKRKLTYNQLMAIGELKRKMNEREYQEAELMPFGENIDLEMSGANHSELPKSSKKPKSKEAYRILESQGIEWDNVEGKWFKKEWL